jgi:polynucleotide 5'-hydroxyl-kinase GRC3/NOL9
MLPRSAYTYAALSAIARLRQTRSQATVLASPPEGQNDGDNAADSSPVKNPAAGTPRKAKKAKNSKASATREEVQPSDAKDSQAAASFKSPPAETNEDGPSPISQSPIIQFSNFTPTKSNFKKKADGKVQLKLSEGDVGIPQIQPLTGAMLTQPSVWSFSAVMASASLTGW